MEKIPVVPKHNGCADCTGGLDEVLTSVPDIARQVSKAVCSKCLPNYRGVLK